MAQPLNPHLRRSIIDAHTSGESYASISRRLHLNYGTVRTLCKRYESSGDAGLIPRYHNCGPKGIKSDALIYRASCWLKRRHPKWGADFIHTILSDRYPNRPIATPRTFQYWFRSKGLTPPRSKPPKEDHRWAKAVHEVWQVDAKEQQKTADRQPCTWLSVVDEHSGALLEAPVFPLQSD